MGPEQEPSAQERELLRRMEAELERLKVSDLLVQTLYTVSSLGFRRLAGDSRDLDEARLAIEALRALVPVLGAAMPAELVRDFNQVTANLQLAYAKAVADESAAPDPDPPAAEEAAPADTDRADASEADASQNEASEGDASPDVRSEADG